MKLHVQLQGRCKLPRVGGQPVRISYMHILGGGHAYSCSCILGHKECRLSAGSVQAQSRARILYCETHCDTSNMGVLGVIDDRCHRDSKSGLVESPLLQPPESEFCSLELRLIH